MALIVRKLDEDTPKLTALPNEEGSSMVKKAIFDRCKISNKDSIKLCKALGETKTLITLFFFRNELSSDGLIEICKGLQVNKSICRLFLCAAQSSMQQDSMEALRQVLADNTTLQHFHFWDNDLGSNDDSMVNLICQGLEQNESLVKLGFERNVLGNPSQLYNILCSCLRHCNLQEISISHTDYSIPDKSPSSSSFIHTFPSSPKIDDTFCTLLKKSRSLLELKLDGNKLDDHDAKYLAQALACNPTLRRLSLARNNIGQDGVNALAQSLRTNTHLQTLGLCRNPSIGIQSMSVFINTLRESNRTLLQLEWDGKNMFKSRVEMKLAHQQGIALEFFLALNKTGRHIVRETNLPWGLWANIFGRVCHNPSMLYCYVADKPEICLSVP